MAATMIWRRRFALAKPIAASAIDCSFWPRQVGSTSFTASSASERQVTLPWPKMAKTPGKSGTFSPSTMRELVAQIAHERLRHGQADGGPGHLCLLPSDGLSNSIRNAY